MGIFSSETDEVKQIIAKKMLSNISKIEEEAIRKVLEEEEFVRSIQTAIAAGAGTGTGGTGTFTAGQFFAHQPPPHDLIMPRGYVVAPVGVYCIILPKSKQNSPHSPQNPAPEIDRITSTPFFIAQKTESGKMLVVRLTNGT